MRHPSSVMQIQSSAAPVFNFSEKVGNARHILIKPNVGYPAKPPVIVRMALLGQVIEQLLWYRKPARKIHQRPIAARG